jgi:hypothetical protein
METIKPDRITVVTTLRADDYRALKTLSNSSQFPMSALIRQAIRRFLKDVEQDNHVLFNP